MREVAQVDRPLLSICIPTYNRATWLRASLTALMPQIIQSGSLVELIVSDNASDDETAEVVREAVALGPVRYHRNETNVGFMRNMRVLATNLAQGDYVWILGDDDLVCNEAVKRITTVLQQHPNIDYIYANYAIWFPAEAPSPSTFIFDLVKLSLPRHSDMQDRQLASLDALIAEDANCFTPIYCSIWRRPLAGEAFNACVTDEPFTSVESVFPHAKFIADHLIHKSGYYLGQPCVVSSQVTTWGSYWPITVLDLLPKLYDCFERSGVDSRVLDRHRRFMLNHSADAMRRMLTQPDTFGRSQFSFGRFSKKHWRYPEYRRIILPVCRSVVIHHLPKRLRGLLRLLRALAQSLRALRHICGLATQIIHGI